MDEDDEEEYCECCGAPIIRYAPSQMKLKDPEPLEDMIFPPHDPKNEKDRLIEIIRRG